MGPQTEDRTPRRTHIFLTAAHLITDHHTHMRVAQVWDVLHLCASEQSSTHNMFHRPLLDVPDTCPFFCSTPSPSSLSMTELRRSPCATPLWGGPSGHLADPNPNTGYEPSTCIAVSSEHTPINHSSRRNSFNTEHDDLTVAASENRDMKEVGQWTSPPTFQEREASIIKCDSADLYGTRKLWCEVMSQFQVLKRLSRGKRDRDLESGQGKCAAQKRLSEAEAEMDIRNWERREILRFMA